MRATPQSIDEILSSLWTKDTPFGQQMQGTNEARQALLALFREIAEELIQSPEYIEDIKHQYPVEKEVRHEVSNEQHQRLEVLLTKMGGE